MFCTTCGTKLDDGARFCTCCGTAVTTQPAAVVVPPRPTVQPVYQPPPVQSFTTNPYQGAVPLQQQININVPQPPVAAPAPKITKWATMRLIFGIITIVLFFPFMERSCEVRMAGAIDTLFLDDEGEALTTGGAAFIASFLWLAAGIVSVAARKTKGGSIATGIIYVFCVGSMYEINFDVPGNEPFAGFAFLALIFAVLLIISGIAQKKQA
jgi:hypothetical protein